MEVARYGAKVRLSPEAQQRQADNYGLLLEATTEGVPVYWFNPRHRRATRNRAVRGRRHPPPANKPKLEAQQLERFRLAPS